MDVSKIMILVLCLLFLPCVFGGTPCPPREQIYPCICLDRSIGKSKYDTTVICHGLYSEDSLSIIEPGLTSMEINTFLLYDSFWSTPDSRRLQADLKIPVNHISSFRMDEVEVVDTILSNFGCSAPDNCRTSYLKKFTAINSTVSDKVLCNNNGITLNSWIGCFQNIQHLTIKKGFTSEITLKPEFFPEPMASLEILLMPYNSIARIDRKTFTSVKFPILHTLDLSHNSLRDIRNIFSAPLKLQYLDLSYNHIRNLIDFQLLGQLQTIKLNNNQIMSLMENDWQLAPSSLRHIDLSNNSIACNCATKWINSTFHISTTLLGTCSSPHQVASQKLRKASRILTERCDELGNIGTKKHKKN